MKKELNSLKEEVRSLRKDLSALHHTKSSSWVVSTCHIFLCLFLPITIVKPISHLLLSVQPSMLRKWAFLGRWRSHKTICIWPYLLPLHTRTMFVKEQSPLHMPQNNPTHQNHLTLSALQPGTVDEFALVFHISNTSSQMGIIVEEHWLWPFELSLLKTIQQDFTYHSTRLHLHCCIW